jgi:hypothetical protein
MKKSHVVVDFVKKCLKCKFCGGFQNITMEMPLPMFVSMAKMFGEIHADCKPPAVKDTEQL